MGVFINKISCAAFDFTVAKTAARNVFLYIFFLFLNRNSLLTAAAFLMSFFFFLHIFPSAHQRGWLLCDKCMHISFLFLFSFLFSFLFLLFHFPSAQIPLSVQRCLRDI